MILKKSLDETVHDKFMERLYAGKYSMGQRIDPAELAESFSISRTPVVQALKRLANERVLDVDRGGKFFITIPTEKKLNDICDVRCLLEEYAVSILIANGNRECLQALRTMAVENERQFGGRDSVDDVTSITQCREFHVKFMEATGNQCLVETYAPVIYQYGGLKYALGSEWKTHQELGNWHIKIMDHILAGEEEKARQATRQHIDECRQDILESIQRIEG